MFHNSKLLLDEELVVPKINSNREYFTLQQMRQQWWNVDSHSTLAKDAPTSNVKAKNIILMIFCFKTQDGYQECNMSQEKAFNLFN